MAAAKKTESSTPKTETRGKTVAKLNTTKIEKCDCKNEYMDKMYGEGMRIKNSSSSGYRCTVCGK